jgi:rhamnosyltransferase
VLFTRKHGRELGISHEGIWQIPQQVVLTVLFETDKLDKLKAFWRGIIDGVRMPLDTVVGK